jgi:hypothetical protein
LGKSIPATSYRQDGIGAAARGAGASRLSAASVNPMRTLRIEREDSIGTDDGEQSPMRRICQRYAAVRSKLRARKKGRFKSE